MKKIINFLYELGMLKRIRHEGWRIIGIESPETVAAHSLRAAQIGYLLAKLENYDQPNEICTMLVWHDIHETRLGDIHKIADRYLKKDKEKAAIDQLDELAKPKIKQAILNLWQQMERKNTTAGIIAKDADLLEQALTAKEYLEQGYSGAQDWINNIKQTLKTDTAKKLIQEIEQIPNNNWWQGLKKLN